MKSKTPSSGMSPASTLGVVVRAYGSTVMKAQFTQEYVDVTDSISYRQPSVKSPTELLPSSQFGPPTKSSVILSATLSEAGRRMLQIASTENRFLPVEEQGLQPRLRPTGRGSRPSLTHGGKCKIIQLADSVSCPNDSGV
jgi:hypothetical protein